jgi:hypothetical protein
MLDGRFDEENTLHQPRRCGLALGGTHSGTCGFSAKRRASWNFKRRRGAVSPRADVDR